MPASPSEPPVAACQEIDVAALEHYLRRNLEGFAGPLEVTRFAGGQSNPTYKLATPTTSFVMRSKPAPAASLLPSAHAIEREFRVLAALQSTGVPVPRVHLHCGDETVIGRAFYVMDHVDGRVLWDPALPGMSRGERAAVYDEMNRVIAALHTVDHRALGLADFGRPGSYFERQIARWTAQYRSSVVEPIEAMERLIDWLPRHVPDSARDDGPGCLVHGDYRLDNLVFHAHEPRIVAVLDWELSTVGHPLADFTYHCLAWRVSPSTFRGMAGADLEALGIPAEADYVRRYCERTGTGDPAAVMADWPFYMAFNLFRVAAILQGIARRATQGTAASALAMQTAAGAVPLAEDGWRIARRG